ncbi:hypothetical protein [Sphaerisporangium rhizosphaerae]|uniref:Uncharacterized protein n=1 Tax=Sphaerisporangium rhizosphaerae TaxID=2269375 RepID=A0ABW2PE83_9ACTN
MLLRLRAAVDVMVERLRGQAGTWGSCASDFTRAVSMSPDIGAVIEHRPSGERRSVTKGLKGASIEWEEAGSDALRIPSTATPARRPMRWICATFERAALLHDIQE